LKFRTAVVTSQGVKFEDGASFDINMDEMEIVGELGVARLEEIACLALQRVGLVEQLMVIPLRVQAGILWRHPSSRTFRRW